VKEVMAMRPVKVTWRKLALELPGEVALFLLSKLVLLLYYLLHI